MPQSVSTIESSVDKNKTTPLHDLILVRPHETPEIKGRLLIPDSCKTVFPTTGVVVQVGWDLLGDDGRSTIVLQPGDRVVYSKYAGIELKFDDGSKLLVLKYEDILCIIGSDLKLIPDESLKS